MALTDKLEPKNSDGIMTLKVGQPAVNVRIPEIKVPEINVPESTVNVDMVGVERALADVAKHLNALAMHLDQLATKQQRTLEIIAQMADKEMSVTVDAPTVKMPPRPRAFGVEIEDEKGDTTYMRIVAESPN